MKLRGILAVFAIAVCGSLCAQNKIVLEYEEGDPRAKYKIQIGQELQELVEEYEAWRESHDFLLTQLGPDLDWEKDVENAKKTGGHVVEATIGPNENVELCMTPADVYKVTHLKLKGRAFQWANYDPQGLGLYNFLKKMKNLKVLNLRDLDCEMFYMSNYGNIEKLVLPANCTATRFSYRKKLKTIVFNSRLECLGEALYRNNKTYSTGFLSVGIGTELFKELTIPHGVLFIAELSLSDNCEKIVLPSTIKAIGRLGNMGSIQHVKSLKEFHVMTPEPPETDSNLEYEHLKNVTLYVPVGSKNTYSRHLFWRNFGNIVEKDFPAPATTETKKESISTLLPGRWTFKKEHLIDNKGHFKDRKPTNLLWWNLENGEYTEGYNKDGVEMTSKLNYELHGNKLHLKLAKGIVIYDIDRITDKELEVSITNKNNGYDYKITFYFSR